MARDGIACPGCVGSRTARRGSKLELKGQPARQGEIRSNATVQARPIIDDGRTAVECRLTIVPIRPLSPRIS